MKPFHGIGGQSAVVGYVVLWTGCHAVQQCLETIGLGFAVEKLLALVCRAILVQLNILLEMNWQVMRIFFYLPHYDDTISMCGCLGSSGHKSSRWLLKMISVGLGHLESHLKKSGYSVTPCSDLKNPQASSCNETCWLDTEIDKNLI